MQQELNDLIEQLKALSPEEARAACWDLFDRLRDVTDPEAVQAIYEGMARVDPKIAAAALCSRRCRQGFESGRAYARGLSVARAREVIDRLAWSFGDSSPAAEELTEQGVQMACIGLERPEVIPALVDLLRSRPQLRAEISLVLGKIGRERKGVGEALTPLLRDPDPAVVDAAAAALAEFGGEGWTPEGAVEALLELYERPPQGSEWPFRDYDSPVVSALASLGSSGCEELVVGAVVGRIRRATGVRERLGWIDLLGEVAGRGAPQAATALVQFLRDGDPAVRYRAAPKFQGLIDREVVTAVCIAMQDPDDDVREAAVASVRDCDPALADAVVPALVAALGDRRPGTGVKAAFCLGQLGAAAKGALPAVRARLRAAEETMAELRAARARAREAYAALREQLREQRKAVRVLRAVAVTLRDAAAGE
jgi:HEAT repeat protein